MPRGSSAGTTSRPERRHCKFTFASWTSNAFEIDTQPRYDLGGKPVPIAFTKDYHPNQEFDLVKIKSHHFDSVYACCDEPPSHSAGTEGPFAALSGHSCCNEPSLALCGMSTGVAAPPRR